MSDEQEPVGRGTLASWVYSKLLKALPSDVSGPFGSQMLALFERMRSTAHERAEVVGMVETSRHNDLTRDGRGTIYVPYSVNPWFEVTDAMSPSVFTAYSRDRRPVVALRMG